MPTFLDKALRSKNLVLAFGGVVAAATVWALSGDLFPADPDPNGDPQTWTREELQRWLEARNLFPQATDSTEQLLARVRANLRFARQTDRDKPNDER